MASAGGDEKAPIIIKKVNKGGDGHHGGAWKVAYADFVTAMMAFFLLLWLLSVTTAEQKLGLADYFSPATPSKQESGAGGVLGGKTITVNGAAMNNSSPTSVAVPLPSRPQASNAFQSVEDATDEAQGKPDGKDDKTSGTTDNNGGRSDGSRSGDGRLDMDQNGDGKVDERELKQALAQHEDQQFKEIEKEVRQAIQQVPELKALQQNVIMQRTPEGERLNLVDQDGYSMFPSGSAKMNTQTAQLLSLVAQAVARLPNKVSITGHTDNTPFANGAGNYGNWELSSDLRQRQPPRPGGRRRGGGPYRLRRRPGRSRPAVPRGPQVAAQPAHQHHRAARASADRNGHPAGDGHDARGRPHHPGRPARAAPAPLGHQPAGRRRTLRDTVTPKGNASGTVLHLPVKFIRPRHRVSFWPAWFLSRPSIRVGPVFDRLPRAFPLGP
ncbi:flagellar motor protein MotB [Nitrospirillum sp. BR 11163]|uniref:flagellar motor protein MotB n=1 Tax=Nitrospirillum sp. BR 11163 TaxID=3104323 RepID=UPI002AFF8A7A|nr:flagellar motor protein MotB [Nitrospirillum sp. BR 11163]MEA1676306.1 flagellar motor protein MotB [Nitrospirillum sp. BR 11163]